MTAYRDVSYSVNLGKEYYRWPGKAVLLSITLSDLPPWKRFSDHWSIL